MKQHPKFYWYCGTEQFQPEVIIEHAVAAERAGFDGIMLSDHLNPWVDDWGASGYSLSVFGAITQKTSSIKLMSGVISPLFRFHPAVIAQAAATIDRLSNGRFELGLGSGENINEGPLGYEFSTYKVRSERMSEAIVIIRRLLEGEELSYRGKYYIVNNFKLYSPPINKIPIYLAAAGEKSAKLAALLCDGVITSVKSINDTKENVTEPALSHTHATTFDLFASRWTMRGKNQDEVWTALQAWRGLRTPNRLNEIDPKKLRENADKLPRSDIISSYTIVNDANDYISAYSPLVTELKATKVCIQTSSVNQLDTIKMIGKEVLPILKEEK